MKTSSLEILLLYDNEVIPIIMTAHTAVIMYAEVVIMILRHVVPTFQICMVLCFVFPV